MAVGGYTDWRVPTTYSYDANCSADIAQGFNCSGSEMAHLFNVDGISAASPGSIFTNVQSDGYWSTMFPLGGSSAYTFNFGTGEQEAAGIGANPGFYFWAVRNGDVPDNTVVPEPGTVSLLACGLVMLAARGRRARA